MTIGPEPMTRMLEMSSRRGIRAFLRISRSWASPSRKARCSLAVHQLGEGPEQVAGVMGPRTCLGVVLDREGQHVPALDALDHPVVQVDVGHVRGGDAAGSDGVAVVLRGDLDPAGGEA